MLYVPIRSKHKCISVPFLSLFLSHALALTKASYINLCCVIAVQLESYVQYCVYS